MTSWPISPLGTNDLDFAVVNYDLAGIAAGALAYLPNLEVAVDSLTFDMIDSLAQQSTLIASMARDLDELGNVLGEMASDDFNQILTDLAGIAAAGDTMLNDVNNLVG